MAAAAETAAAAGSEQDTAAAGTIAAVDKLCLEGEGQASDDDGVWQSVSSACVVGVQAVHQLLPAVQLPGAAGSAAACAAAHQLLQQQCTQLLGQLVPPKELSSSSSSRRSSSSSSSETSVDLAAPQVPLAHAATLNSDCGQQLVRVGQALCAQLPVPLCCNNPSCVELRGASEQQLVASKGSVCSGCRWVAAGVAERRAYCAVKQPDLFDTFA
jgi:hypothetical protein